MPFHNNPKICNTELLTKRIKNCLKPHPRMSNYININIQQYQISYTHYYLNTSAEPKV